MFFSFVEGEVEQRTHPDALWLEPSSPTSSMPIEAVRRLLQQLHQTPVQSPRHVAVILSVEQLSDDAATTLLKMIEEPPNTAHLLLTTHDLGRCLPTIVSRCAVMRVGPLGRAALAQALTQHHDVPAPRAQQLATWADGRVGQARRWLEAKQLPTAERFFQELQGRDWSAERRAELCELLESYVWWCRDQVCDGVGFRETLVSEGADAPNTLAATVDDRLRLVDEALMLREALERRVNPKLVQWALQQRWHAATRAP